MLQFDPEKPAENWLCGLTGKARVTRRAGI